MGARSCPKSLGFAVRLREVVDGGVMVVDAEGGPFAADWGDEVVDRRLWLGGGGVCAKRSSWDATRVDLLRTYGW